MIDVLAIDPGLVSGCAHVRVNDGVISVIESAELNPLDTGLWLEKALENASYHGSINDTTVVVERFVITPKTGANTQAPWSLEVIGQTKWIVAKIDPARDPLVRMQSPADAKAAMPNPRLRELGLWHRGGKGHALDALRHAGLYLLRQRMIKPRIAASDSD